MKTIRISLIFFLAFASFIVPVKLLAQTPQSGADVLRLMHKRYHNGPCKSYTFSQKNTHYRNDSVIRHSEWHEAVEFPDKFRINFGDRAEGNFVVFKNDSAYNYKKGLFTKSRSDSNTVLLIIGGMYYRTLEDVMHRFKSAGYDLSIMSTQQWKGVDVYVIGAKENNVSANQLWIDKKELKVLRIIEKFNSGDIMDMRFEAHQSWCNGFVETKVSFRRNGKLEQSEEYYDIKKASVFPDK